MCSGNPRASRAKVPPPPPRAMSVAWGLQRHLVALLHVWEGAWGKRPLLERGGGGRLSRERQKAWLQTRHKICCKRISLHAQP